MNLHTLEKTAGSSHRKMRVGRGRASGKGKTSGRGHKGQMARSGSRHKPTFEGGQMPYVRRVSKRGFTSPFQRRFAPVNLCALNAFEPGTEVTEDLLRQAGLVNGSWDGIKILGKGTVDRKLAVKAHAFSKAAQAALEAAGGSCETVA